MAYFRIGDGVVRDAETGEARRWDAEFPDHIGASALRGRGWSDAMIRSLLGAADLTVENPRFAKSARARLWLRSRVEAAEASAAFGSAREKAERPARSAERGYEPIPGGQPKNQPQTGASSSRAAALT